MPFTRLTYSFVEAQEVVKSRMTPAPFAMLLQTFLREHLVFETYGNRRMESFDPCDTGFLEDAQAALVEHHSDIL